MKLSEAVGRMQTMLAEVGDLDIVAVAETDKTFTLALEVEIDAFAFPSDVGKFEGPYCAIIINYEGMKNAKRTEQH